MQIISSWRSIWAVFLISEGCAQAQNTNLDHFTWQLAGSPPLTGQALSVTIKAKTVDDLDLPAYRGSVNLTALERLPSTPALITEVSPVRQAIEFMNPSPVTADISGWRIETSAPGATRQRLGLRFPAGTLIPAGGVFQVAFKGGITGGACPLWHWNYTHFWDARGATGIAAWLLDAQGQPADIVCLGSADPTSISGPDFVPFWHGPTLPLQNIGPNQSSWQRVGRYNNRSSQNWLLAALTLGSQNAGLANHFLPEETVWPILPASVVLSNGSWSGTIAQSGNQPRRSRPRRGRFRIPIVSAQLR